MLSTSLQSCTTHPAVSRVPISLGARISPENEFKIRSLASEATELPQLTYQDIFQSSVIPSTLWSHSPGLDVHLGGETRQIPRGLCASPNSSPSERSLVKGKINLLRKDCLLRQNSLGLERNSPETGLSHPVARVSPAKTSPLHRRLASCHRAQPSLPGLGIALHGACALMTEDAGEVRAAAQTKKDPPAMAASTYPCA